MFEITATDRTFALTKRVKPHFHRGRFSAVTSNTRLCFFIRAPTLHLIKLINEGALERVCPIYLSLLDRKREQG